MNINSASSSTGGGLGPAASMVQGAQKRINTDESHGVSAVMSGDLNTVKSTDQRDTGAAAAKSKPDRGQLIKNDKKLLKAASGFARFKHSVFIPQEILSAQSAKEPGAYKIEHLLELFMEKDLFAGAYKTKTIAELKEGLIAAIQAENKAAKNSQKEEAATKELKEGEKKGRELKERLELSADHEYCWVISGVTKEGNQHHLTPVTPKQDVLYHGTTRKAWEEAIRSDGLIGMNLKHTHLVASKEAARTTGARHTGGDESLVVVLEIDVAAMRSAPEKYRFYDGGSDIHFQIEAVPAEYIKEAAETAQ